MNSQVKVGLKMTMSQAQMKMKVNDEFIQQEAGDIETEQGNGSENNDEINSKNGSSKGKQGNQR